ncbi:MAG: hypothetical protein ISR48_06380 [Alphaproteobacteria bacterium]|nr:hypothetical protein [Alphaproteobacteria bacterium]
MNHDFAIKLNVPSEWASELNTLSHASQTTRLGYIRSKLREAMDKDFTQLNGQIEKQKMFRDGGESGEYQWEDSY